MEILNALILIGMILGISHIVAQRGVKTGLTYRFWFLLMTFSAGVLAPYIAIWVFVFRRKPKAYGNVKDMQKVWMEQALKETNQQYKKDSQGKDWIKVCEDCKKPIQFGSPMAKELQEKIDNGTGRIYPSLGSGNPNQPIHESYAESARKERLYEQFFCNCFTEKMIKDWEDENK